MSTRPSLPTIQCSKFCIGDFKEKTPDVEIKGVLSIGVDNSTRFKILLVGIFGLSLDELFDDFPSKSNTFWLGVSATPVSNCDGSNPHKLSETPPTDYPVSAVRVSVVGATDVRGEDSKNRQFDTAGGLGTLGGNVSRPFDNQELIFAGLPQFVGGSPKRDCRDSQDSREKRNVRVSVVKYAAPQVEQRSNDRDDRAFNYAAIFFCGVIGTALAIGLMTKSRP